MKLLLPVGLVLATVALTSFGADNQPPVRITWFGQACMLITTPENTRILIDPVDIGDYKVPESVVPDVTTVSHNHRDQK